MANILSRYILRETLGTWLAVTGVLLVILLTNQVATVLARAAEQGFPREAVLELVWLGALSNVAVLLPIGLLLGIMIAFGRLYQDSEMTAALACGVAPWRIHLPIAALAVTLAAVVAALTFVVAPQAAARVDEVRVRALQAGEFSPIAPGRFRSFGGGSAVFYAESRADDGTLQKVFVKRVREQRYEIAVAARARHDVSADGTLHTLTLFDGERYEGVPGANEFRIIRFAENVIPVRVPERTAASMPIEGIPTARLWLAQGGVTAEDLEYQAEFHWRLALPLMVFVLAMLAGPLSQLRPRQGRYARIWLGIVVYFVYFSLASAAKVWLTRGSAPAALGLWWVHLMVIGLTLAVIVAPSWQARWRYRRATQAAGVA